MKICEYCGTEFEPKQWRSKYCSRRCQIRGHYQSKTKGTTKKCVWCGEKFFAENRQKKYCSVSCRNQACYEVTKERAKSKYPPKECKHCGKEFVPRDIRQIYCSKECSAIHNRLKYQALAEERKKAREESKRLEAEMRKNEPKKEYQYRKYDGIEVPQPKPIEKLSPASKRWAKMSWMELTKELQYYGLRYPDAQLMAKNNTLPKDFGLKRKKAKKCQQ